MSNSYIFFTYHIILQLSKLKDGSIEGVPDSSLFNNCLSLFFYSLSAVFTSDYNWTFLIKFALLSFSLRMLSISSYCYFDLWISFCWNYFFFYSITFALIFSRLFSVYLNLFILSIRLSSCTTILHSNYPSSRFK